MADGGPWERYQNQDDGPWSKYAPPKTPLISPELEQQLQQQSQHYLEDYPDDSIAVPGDERRITPEHMHRLQGLGGSYHEINYDPELLDYRVRALGGDITTPKADGPSLRWVPPPDRYPLPDIPRRIYHPGPFDPDPGTNRRLYPRPPDDGLSRSDGGFPELGQGNLRAGPYRNISGDASRLVDPITPRRVKTETIRGDKLPSVPAADAHPADRYATPAGVPPVATKHPADKYSKPESFASEAWGELKRAPGELWDMAKRMGPEVWARTKEQYRLAREAGLNPAAAALHAGVAGGEAALESELSQTLQEGAIGGFIGPEGRIVRAPRIEDLPPRTEPLPRTAEEAPSVVERPSEHAPDIKTIPSADKAAGTGAAAATRDPIRGVSEPDPHPLGAQVAAQSSQTATAAAKPGQVNRFTLRPLRSIFDRKQGRYEALQVEIKNDLQMHKTEMGTPLDAEAYRFGERDPTHSLNPEGQLWFEDNVRPILRENQDTYRRVLKKAKDQDLPSDDVLEIQWENPAYMHRRTADSAKQMLGQMERESDPVIGRLGGVPRAASTQKRKFFALTNEATGARLPAYVDKGNVYTIGRTFPEGVLAFDKKSLPSDFKPVRGSKFQMRGQQWRIGEAYTREIEDAGGPTYLKSALTSSRLNKLELGRMEGALDAQAEIRQQLLKSNLASPNKGGGFAYKTNMPGLSNLYMPQRVAKYLDGLVPKRFDDESLTAYLARAQQIQATSLFWNPLFHPGNVAAHVPMARGFRGLNPVANIRYIGRLRDAWKSVATQDARYRQWEAAGLRQMLGPRLVREQLNDLMFSHLEEMKSPQGQELLTRLGKIFKVPPLSILRAEYKWAGNTMWQLGDLMNQATAEEILATGPFGGKRATPLDMAAAAEKVHRHVPAYRIPVEEMLPGAPGRAISKALQSPGMGLVNWFARYHENIDRAYAMMGEDLWQGTKHLDAEQVADGLGAIMAFGTGMAVYNYGLDPMYRQYIDKEGEAKRFGPYAPAQILVDWLSAKSVSPGRKLHLVTGGLYSPSGMTEMGANMLGLHAFSLRPLQPWAPEALVGSEKEVPWQARAKQAAISTLPPVSSLADLYRQPNISNVMQMLGAGQYQRHTEEEYKKRRASERAGKPHRGLKKLQRDYPWGF